MRQRNLVILFGTFLMMIFQTELLFAKKFNDKFFTFFQWQNPAPRFADLGLTLEEAENVVGNTQLLINHTGRDIKLWTPSKNGGEIKEYKNARFVSSLAIFNKSRERVVEFFYDIENYQKFMGQFSDSKVIKKEGQQFLYGFTEVYNFFIFKLKADFRYLSNSDKNGNLSVLLLEGDTGAGVERIEFIALDKYRTLVVRTGWADMNNTKLAFSIVVKAQPDLKLTVPMGYYAMIMKQFKDELDHDEETSLIDEYPVTGELCPPLFSEGKIPLSTLRRLSGMGTLVFVHPSQWIKTGDTLKEIDFVSTLGQNPGTLEQSKPILCDFTRTPEYFRHAKKITSHPAEKADGHVTTDWKLRLGFGVVSVGVDYTTEQKWLNDNTVLLKSINGDFDPFIGATELIDLQNGNTLTVLTTATQIGEEASWVLKLANKVPNMNVFICIFSNLLMIENQPEWLRPQIETAYTVSN